MVNDHDVDKIIKNWKSGKKMEIILVVQKLIYGVKENKRNFDPTLNLKTILQYTNHKEYY